MCAYPLGPSIPSKEPPPVVQYDCACARCAYNLRGLSPTGVCPECGAAVAVSLQGRLLRFAARAYVRSLDIGLTILLCAIWVYVLLLAVSIFLGMYLRGSQSRELALVVSLAVMLLPALAFVIGYWKFTTPDEADAAAPPVNARSIIRVAVCIQLAAKLARVAIALAIEAQVAAATTGGFVSPLEPIALVLRWIDIAAFVTLFYAVLVHARAIADRVPDVEIRARAKGFMWFLPVIFVGGYFFFGIGPIAALILFASLLQSLQEHLKAALDWQERGGRFTFN